MLWLQGKYEMSAGWHHGGAACSHDGMYSSKPVILASAQVALLA